MTTENSIESYNVSTPETGYPPEAFMALPTMEAVEGIRFDFNDGLRVRFPNEGGPWRLVFGDIDTDTQLCDQLVSSP